MPACSAGHQLSGSCLVGLSEGAPTIEELLKSGASFLLVTSLP